MAPLFLTFKNADPLGQNVVVMFKSGDDLRQDMLTLQLLRVMDKVMVLVASFFR
jgi:phosphatidylinositol kinase/protein kinase (PI-3  family)